MELLLGLLGGGLISWFITRFYYLKSSNDQRILFAKLPEVLKKLVIQDKHDKLTIRELNELINQKVTDTSSKDSLPYIACPKCGSINLNKSSEELVDFDEDGPHLITFYDTINCKECGWSKNTLENSKKINTHLTSQST